MTFYPLDFHCHGIDKFDFSEIRNLNLDEIDNILSSRKINCIITLFLFESYFNEFLSLLSFYWNGKKEGKYKHITGIALEGPLLSSSGGTPTKTSWYPTRKQWLQLAEWGNKGLLYVVFSPDVYLCGKIKQEEVLWITETLIDGGILPAPGHFLKIDPEESGKSIVKVLEVVEKKGKGPIVSDHLYNDMPKKLIHAWRSPSEKKIREKQIEELNLSSWNKHNLQEKLGPVPFALIQGAFNGLIKLCLNFDGEHVDLEISKRTVEILGSSNLIAMTDRIETLIFGRQQLKKYDHSSLLYQKEDLVAAGTNTIESQMNKMRQVGLSECQIWDLFAFVPYKVLKINPSNYSVVTKNNIKPLHHSFT